MNVNSMYRDIDFVRFYFGERFDAIKQWFNGKHESGLFLSFRYRERICKNSWISKDHLINSSEEKPDLYADQDQQYFLIKRKTKCKADRTAKRVI